MSVVLHASRAGKVLLKAPILFYRLVISPWLGPHCRFEPSCSVYALEAIERHGAVKGLWLAIRRLSKCHPVTWLGGSHGLDPVPDTCTLHRSPLPSGRRE